MEFTAREGYGDALEFAGSSFVEFLANLDDMHAHIALSFPHLDPPSFELDDGDRVGRFEAGHGAVVDDVAPQHAPAAGGEDLLPARPLPHAAAQDHPRQQPVPQRRRR